MASAISLLSEEQFQCSICLDVFTEPVSTPCGHNFCKACITRHWEHSKLSQCPLCNEKFSKTHKLRVNTGFKEVVENFKKMKVMDKGKSPVEPGEVPCDICPGTKLKALKSCLVCLASYCQTHLEPHQRVTALKRHKLIDPVENLEDRMCSKHDKILEVFCRSDQICVCVMCTEHKSHDTVPLEEEYEERKAQLGMESAEVQEMLRERQQKIQEMKASVQLNKKDIEEEIAESVQAFAALVALVQRNQAELIEEIEEKQRAAEEQATEFVKELEKEITELRRRSSELERLSHTEDHLYLLQSFPSVSSPHTKTWSDISVRSPLCAGTVRRAVAQLEETLTKETERVIREVKACVTVQKQMEPIKENAENPPEDLELKMIQQQYAVDVTLDADTANHWLIFTGGMKQVQTGNIWWYYHDNTKRFNRYRYMLGNMGFSTGRFYYEVQVKGKTSWDLGLVKESINRKGKLTACPKNGIWIISLKENKYKALDDRHVPLFLREKPEKIGVFVDYEAGLVSFYDVEAGALIYSFTGCTFTERLYPCFSPGPLEGGKNWPPLIITPVKNTQTEFAEIPNYILIIFFVIIVLFLRCLQ